MPFCRDSALSISKFLELGVGRDCGGERSRRRMRRREIPAIAAVTIMMISSHVCMIWNYGFDFISSNFVLIERYELLCFFVTEEKTDDGKW